MEKINETKTTEIKFNEKLYNDMSKESLVKLLILRDMLDLHLVPENNTVTLWCYVADKTGCKYITNEMPKQFFVADHTEDNEGLYLTDGEVNIRVPKCMDSMFPDLKYGDEPMKIDLTITF